MIRLTLRLPPDIHARLTVIARNDNRSVNAEVIWLLAQALKGRSDNSDTT